MTSLILKPITALLLIFITVIDSAHCQPTYSVLLPKTYFYSKADYSFPKTAYLVPSDIITSIKDSNGFVYAEFTNKQKQITKGWVSKLDLIDSKSDQVNLSDYIQEEYAGKYDSHTIQFIIESMRNGILRGYIEYTGNTWGVYGVYNKSTNELKIYNEQKDELLIGKVKKQGKQLEIIRYDKRKQTTGKFILNAIEY